MKKSYLLGSGLIEVQVSAFILAVGLLGCVELQLKSAKLSQRMYIRESAEQLAESMLERVRAHRTIGKRYAEISQGEGYQSSCCASNLIKRDLDQWRSDLKAQIPNGRGQVYIKNNRVTVEVAFDLGGSDQPSQRVVLESIL